MPLPPSTPSTPENILAAFTKIDAAILQSIVDGDTARKRQDRARTPNAYERASRSVHAAQDRHTAAWTARNALCAQWDAYYAKEYPTT